jgi:type I restriction enzyme S subunit
MIGGNIAREIAVIPLLTDVVDPRFAMYLLAAPSNQARMVGHVKGTSYLGINLKDVRTLPLPIPPIPEQQRIVAELEALRQQINIFGTLRSESSREMQAILPSILNDVFATNVEAP